MKDLLIKEILKYEWEMFVNVKNAGGGPASCQQMPDEFRIFRHSHFSPWSDKTLNSYLLDLRDATSAGYNLMTYKYARMDDLIPSANSSLYIDKIVKVQIEWQEQMLKSFPNIVSKGRAVKGKTNWASFETYLKSELETYSEETLENLYADISTYKIGNKNMSELVYRHLALLKGYTSLEEAEKANEVPNDQSQSNVSDKRI